MGECRFDDIVSALAHDRRWRRRVRMVRLRCRVGRGCAVAMRGLAEVGCLFTAVPPQRCPVGDARV